MERACGPKGKRPTRAASWRTAKSIEHCVIHRIHRTTSRLNAWDACLLSYSWVPSVRSGRRPQPVALKVCGAVLWASSSASLPHSLTRSQLTDGPPPLTHSPTHPPTCLECRSPIHSVTHAPVGSQSRRFTGELDLDRRRDLERDLERERREEDRDRPREPDRPRPPPRGADLDRDLAA